MLAPHCTLEMVINGAEAVEQVQAHPAKYSLVFMNINACSPSAFVVCLVFWCFTRLLIVLRFLLYVSIVVSDACDVWR
jgi:hypothetical protein